MDDDILEAVAKYMIAEVRCIKLSKKDKKVLEGKSQDEYEKTMIKIASDKIQTWLVNNRTRRWRPSLEEAFDNKRPAILLLEDGMRLFSDETLRPVHGWNGDTLFASDPKYSIPLKEWKKAKGKKSKGKSAGNRGASKSSNAAPKSGQATSSFAARKPSEQKKTPRAHTKRKSRVLNETTSPPLADISPMCTQIDKMLVEEGVVSDFAQV